MGPIYSYATPDGIRLKIEGKTISESYESKGTYPFIIKDNECLIGRMSSIHPQMKFGTGKIMHYISGRLYSNYNILTIWHFNPKMRDNKYDYIDIMKLKDITDKITLSFPAFNINTWYIAYNKEYILISDFLNNNINKEKENIKTTKSGLSTKDFWRHYEIIG